MPAQRNSFSFVGFWVCLCAFLNLTGWMLSALHALNRVGYVVAFVVAAVICVVFRKQLTPGPIPNARKLRRRFRRAVPASFLVTATIAILGGAIYPPWNYDALAYRLPRVLHWLAAGQWHWIHTIFPRLNVRAAGIEWVSAPLMLFTHSDRGLFLINSATLLLLPTLVFSVSWRLGVRKRVAWLCMWVVPCGYVFITQVGSLGNDLFGSLFPLAALDFALRARARFALREAGLSMLAAALMTAAKATNIPLGLPWLVIFWPCLRSFFQKPLWLTIVLVVGLFSSFVPTGFLNWKYTGDWTGTLGEGLDWGRVPTTRLIWEGPILLATESLAPPFLPNPRAVERGVQAVMALHLPGATGDGYPRLQPHFDEMLTDGNGGMGLGVWLLLAAGWVASRRLGKRGARRPIVPRGLWLTFCAAVIIAVAAFMSKTNKFAEGAAPRLFSPYYPLLAVIIGAQLHENILRRGWFRKMICIVQGVALGLVVLSPGNPFWPAVTVLKEFHSPGRGNHLTDRMWDVYTIYRSRSDAFSPLTQSLPNDARVIGLIGFDQLETSIWRPFGQRRVFHVTPSDTRESLQAQGMRYVLVSAQELKDYFNNTTIQDWVRQQGGGVIGRQHLRTRAARGDDAWFIVDLKAAGQ